VVYQLILQTCANVYVCLLFYTHAQVSVMKANDNNG